MTFFKGSLSNFPKIDLQNKIKSSQFRPIGPTLTLISLSLFRSESIAIPSVPRLDTLKLLGLNPYTPHQAAYIIFNKCMILKNEN